MTKEERKKTSSQILTKMEESSNSKSQDESLISIQTAIDEDEVNRNEFLKNNAPLNAYCTELINSYGLSFLHDIRLPISTVVYLNNGSTIISKTDSQDLWDGASLTTQNLFFIPYGASMVYELKDINSQKLVMDPEKQFDADGTSNYYPIIPTNLKTIITKQINALNEKTVMDLIDIVMGFYTTGYNLGFPYFSTSFIPEDNKFIYKISGSSSDSSFVLNDYVFFNSVDNYFVGKIIQKGYDFFDGNYAHYIKIEKLTNTDIGERLTFSSEMPPASSSSQIKKLVISIVNYWRVLVLEQITNLQNIPSKSSSDINQITILNNLLNRIDTWLGYDESTKFTNISYLTSVFPTRRTQIDTRKSVLFPNDKIIKTLMEKRNEIIVLRLKKRGGTLNKVFREVGSYLSQEDQKETDTGSFEYFRKKLIVKKVIEDCTDSKVIYINDNDLVNNSKLYINDIVYIVSDTRIELKTFIVSIVDAVREKKTDKSSIKKETINVKKVTLANRIPSNYTIDENTRLIKELE